MKAKHVAALAVLTAYLAFPPYRYYVLGSWIAYNIASGKPRKRYWTVKKGSKHYNRLVGGGHVHGHSN